MKDLIDEEVTQESWGDVRLTGIQWLKSGRDLALSWALHGNRSGILTCTWVHSINMKVITVKNVGGFPLTYSANFHQMKDGCWQLQFDFAGQGVIEFICNDMSLSLKVSR